MSKYLIKLSKDGDEIGVHSLKRAACLSFGRPFIARKIRRRRRLGYRLGPWKKYVLQGNMVRRLQI